MPYQAPGAYAQFVQTAGAVNNPGASRIMALIGTGVQTYTVYNEPIVRNPNSTADMLQNNNVYQIIAVSTKPYYPTKQLSNNILFTQTGNAGTSNQPEFSLQEGDLIAWSLTSSGTISAPKAGPTSGARAWVNAQTPIGVNGSTVNVVDVQAVVDTADANLLVNGSPADETFMLQNGTYMVEITYVDPLAGSYRIIDMSNNAIIGEYACGTPNYEAIPGVKLNIQTTFVADPSDPTHQTSLTQVGDYVTVTTTSGQTAGLPNSTYTVNNDGSLTLANGSTFTGIKSPNAGDVYYVSYKYRKPDTGFAPQVFFNYYDIVNEYGDYQVTASGKVINSLTLGAQVAMQNGVSTIVCVQAKSENDADINAAIDSLTRAYPGIDTVNAIVPLTGFNNSYNVAAHLADHCTEMSSELYGKERMGYVAAINPNDTVSAITTAVGTYQNERLVFVVPASATMSIKDANTGQYNVRTLPGSYLATAVAAVALSQDPAEPLTNKQINGFINLGALYSDSEMNMMAGAGALVLKQSGPVIRIRHGVTTSTADVNSSEITVVQIKDYVIQAVRKVLGDLYVGHKLMPTLVADVKSTLQNILNQFVAQQVILSFNIVSVTRSTLNPTEIDVSFQIEAVYPLNYIMIQFGFSSAITG